MLTRRRALYAGGAAGAGLLVFWFYPGRPVDKPTGLDASRVTDAWIETVHAKAEHGYWLVVRGTHIGDQVVAAATAAGLSHAAVFDKERDEVIEAVGKGVVVTPLRELLAQAHRLVIIKPRDYSADEGRAAVERARAVVGHKYDWLGTVGAQNERRFYCTELCAYSFRARERGLVKEAVIYPEKMDELGDVIFDSGPRESSQGELDIDDALRARFAKRLDDARGVAYAAKVSDGVYRGGVPDEQGVAWLKSIGITTVINLRHFHGDSEGDLVRAAGMRYERIPLESTDAPQPAQVARFLEIVNDEAARPIYVHCLHGVDRTGTMLAVYRMEKEGWTNSDALAEMEWFGAHGLLHDLRRFVAGYTPSKSK